MKISILLALVSLAVAAVIPAETDTVVSIPLRTGSELLSERADTCRCDLFKGQKKVLFCTRCVRVAGNRNQCAEQATNTPC